MGTAADTLVTKFPDRISQLQGPVYNYLKKGMPYTGDDQDLYMQVFYPKARSWSSDTTFSAAVQKVNPGIVTVADYVNLVNRARGPSLSSDEEEALQSVADALGVSRDSLYQLIALESGWNPQATNKYTGARGLIQFMPSTALWMGFVPATTSILLIGALLGAGYYFAKKYGYL
jgi:soluble lytic murein transglycosylase-like protein